MLMGSIQVSLVSKIRRAHRCTRCAIGSTRTRPGIGLYSVLKARDDKARSLQVGSLPYEQHTLIAPSKSDLGMLRAIARLKVCVLLLLEGTYACESNSSASTR